MAGRWNRPFCNWMIISQLLAQLVGALPVHAPLGGERRGPVQGNDLTGFVPADVAMVPDAGSFEHGHPHLAVAVIDVATGDQPLLVFARQRNLGVLLAAIGHRHHDAIAIGQQMHQEVLAGQFRLGHGNLRRIHHDVVGEEVGHHHEPAGGLDRQRFRAAGLGFGLHEKLACGQIITHGAGPCRRPT